MHYAQRDNIYFVQVGIDSDAYDSLESVFSFALWIILLQLAQNKDIKTMAC